MDWSPVPFTFSLFWKFIPEVTRQAAVQLDAVEWETMARDSENVYYTVSKNQRNNKHQCLCRKSKQKEPLLLSGRPEVTACLSLAVGAVCHVEAKPFEFAAWRRWQEAAHYPRIVVVLSHLTDPRSEEVCRCKFFVLETVNSHDRRDFCCTVNNSCISADKRLNCTCTLLHPILPKLFPLNIGFNNLRQ